MRKILVTGGTGLIGSHLVKSLSDNYNIYAVARSGSVKGAMHTINIDLGGYWSDAELPKDVDTIVHLAQSEHYRDFPEEAMDVFSVNTLSTVKLLDYARRNGVRQFVLASSGGVYGSGSTGFSEDEAIIAKGDLGYYIGTRVCSEVLADCYSPWFNVVTLRFFFVYGSGQRPNMLVPRLVDSVRLGRPIQLNGIDGLRINPVHVSDAVEALHCAMLHLEGSHKINIAGPDVISLRRMGEIIGNAIGVSPKFDVSRNGSCADLVGDIERMSSFLCRPQIGFEEGIQDYLSGK